MKVKKLSKVICPLLDSIIAYEQNYEYNDDNNLS